MSSLPKPNPNVPQINQPLADVGALAFTMRSVKQGLDSLAGYRGQPNDRAVTFNDLLSLGVVVSTGSAGSGGVITTTTTVLPVVGPQELIGLGGTVSAQATSIAVGTGLSINAGGSLVVTTSAGVTTVVAGAGLAGGTITSTGTISLGTIAAGRIMANPSVGAAVPTGVSVGSGLSLNAAGTLFATGTGVTTVVAGAGLAGGTITSTGTISLGTIIASSLMGNPSVGAAVPTGVTVGTGLSLNAAGTLFASHLGDVTLVVAGAGLAGGTITSAGTISLGTIGAGQIMGNPSVGAAVPAGITVGSNMSLNAGGTLNITTNPTIAGSLTSSGLIVPTGSIGVKGNASATPVQVGSIGEYLTSQSPGTPFAGTTVTFTLGSPGTVNWTAHGLIGCVGVQFSTSGALPTGLTAATPYYTIPSSITTNSFQVATSVANALAGTAINFTGSQSGTQTAFSIIPLANNTATNLAARTLTAGIWLVSGAVGFDIGAGSAAVAIVASVGTTSAGFSGSPFGGGLNQVNYSSPLLSTSMMATGTLVVGPSSGAITVYLVAQQGSGSTWQGYGFIGALRVG